MSSTTSRDIGWYFFGAIETLITGTAGFDDVLKEVVGLGKKNDIEALSEWFSDVVYEPGKPEPLILKKARHYNTVKDDEGCQEPMNWGSQSENPFPVDIAFRRMPVTSNTEYGAEMLLIDNSALIIPWPLPARDPRIRKELEEHVNDKIEIEELSEEEYAAALPIRSMILVFDILQVLGNWDKGNGISHYIANLENPTREAGERYVFLRLEANLKGMFREWPSWERHTFVNNTQQFQVVFEPGRASTESSFVVPMAPDEPVVFHIGGRYVPSICKAADYIYDSAQRVEQYLAPPSVEDRLDHPPTANRVWKRGSMHSNVMGCARVGAYNDGLRPRWIRLITALAPLLPR
ncbi:MAG: hypothetical protein AAGJ10_08265 [Bacteroidota bacterium]